MVTMPAAWAACGLAKLTRLAGECDGPGIGRLRAGQDLQKRRLAGAILAEEGVDLGGAHFEVDGLERAHAGKGLGNPLHAQKRCRAR